MRVFSVGYQGLSISDLVERVRDAEASIILDVRKAPWSRRPEFRKQALKAAFRLQELEYRHIPEAGNPFFAMGQGGDGLQQYRAYLHQHTEVIERLYAHVVASASVVMCVCANPARCHRQFLLEELQARGVEVVELRESQQLTLL